MNPFKSGITMLPIASINSVYVDDTLASDLFRPSLMIQDVLDEPIFQLDQTASYKETLRVLNESFMDSNHSAHDRAKEIVNLYASRFYQVIKTLKRPSTLSIRNRIDWTTEHWNYWQTIQKVYFVGGITELEMIEFFSQFIKQQLLNDHIQLDIEFVPFSGNIGVSGLAIDAPIGESMIFDFGQTTIKRGYVKKEGNSPLKDIKLEPLYSQHLDYHDVSEEELKRSAYQLHTFILSTIIDTYNELHFKGDTILISIANYVNNGVIYKNRGGYGKLHYLGDNYQEILQSDCRRNLHQNIHIQLYHDTTAMSIPFKNKQKCAIISLGTAFGIAFP